MTTFNSLGIGRTIGAGVNDLYPSDFQISLNSTNGIIILNLPTVSSVLSERASAGYLQIMQFLLADISGTAGTNKITVNAQGGETINGLSSVDLNINNISAVLTPTSHNTWSLAESITSTTPDVDDYWALNGNTNASLKSIGTLNNFDFPIIVNGVEVTRVTTDNRQFWNDTKTNNGSNAGLQYSSLIANRAQLRNNQYGANNAGAGITTFKSRGAVIGAPLSLGDGLLVGDIVQGFTAIGVTGDGLLIPIVYTQRVTVSQSNPTSLATDWTIQLCPLNGITNSLRNIFRVTSEGIQAVRESANSMAGFAVLDGTGSLVVANTNVKATTRFILTIQDGGAVPTQGVYVSSRINGTSFTISSMGVGANAGVQVYYQLYEQLT